MKRIFILFILLLTLTAVKAQVQIVNDPTNLAKIAQVLEAGKQQIESIREQTKLFKEAQEAMRKVNRELNKIRTIKSAIEQQSRLIENFSQLTEVPQGQISDEALLTYLNRIESYRTQVIDNNQLILQLFSDEIFKMSDYERIKLMQETIEKNDIIMEKAKAEKKYYDEMNKQLEILMSLKKKK